MNAALLFAMQALQYVPQIIQSAGTLEAAGQAVAQHIQATDAALQKMQAEKRDPTAEEWAAQAAVIAGLRAGLHSA